MKRLLADQVRFARAFAANPRQVGAILPTSRWAVRDMLDLADVRSARLVVELGAGTGASTREILGRMRPDARLLALEIDPRLADLLAERVDDPRLTVICDSAEHLEAHLDGERADVLVSMLPFTSLEPPLRRRILDALPAALAPEGVLLVIQYSALIQRELRKRFPSVRRRISPLNVPPAVLFACALHADGAAGRPSA